MSSYVKGQGLRNRNKTLCFSGPYCLIRKEDTKTEGTVPCETYMSMIPIPVI